MGAVTAEKVLAVTGAAGFIGRGVVAAARAEGYAVRAIVRDRASAPMAWQDDPLISVHVLDLAAGDAAARAQPALAGVVAVIHLAAAMDGNDATHRRDTLGGTRNLLSALDGLPEPRPRLVLASSLAVYDAFAVPLDGVLDEAAPLERAPAMRDAYCRAKLAQEAMVRDAGLEAVILRPGAVAGAGRQWNGHLGARFGRLLITTGLDGQVPLCALEICAKAMIQAVHWPAGSVVNLIDRKLPDRRTLIAGLQQGGLIRLVVPVPWRLAALIADIGAYLPFLSRRLPGLLRPRSLRARMLPIRYSAARLAAMEGEAGRNEWAIPGKKVRHA